MQLQDWRARRPDFCLNTETIITTWGGVGDGPDRDADAIMGDRDHKISHIDPSMVPNLVCA